MDKGINNNGYDYVDLGLPSGTLWATCNVGASKPSDTGLYFQWGDTKGYTAEQVGKDKLFLWTDYKWNPSGDDETFTRYENPCATLELEDDAAQVNMGGGWHIPTPNQIQELIDNTTSEWTEQDGVNGILFISNSDGSKSIFIPAVGGAFNGSIFNSGVYGYIWSSMLNTDFVNIGKRLGFYSNGVFLYSSCRYYGFSVRGVIG